MAETFYEKRMSELNNAQVQHALNVTGSPLLNRPQQVGNPMAQQPAHPVDDTQEQLDAFHNTHFGQLTQRFEQEDPHYGVMIKNLTDIALALKDQVDNGYMPLAVANQKIHDFINDHRQGYKNGNRDKVLAGQLAGQAALAQQQQQQQSEQAQPSPEASITPEDAQSAIAGDEGQGGAV